MLKLNLKVSLFSEFTDPEPAKVSTGNAVIESNKEGESIYMQAEGYTEYKEDGQLSDIIDLGHERLCRQNKKFEVERTRGGVDVAIRTPRVLSTYRGSYRVYIVVRSRSHLFTRTVPNMRSFYLLLSLMIPFF